MKWSEIWSKESILIWVRSNSSWLLIKSVVKKLNEKDHSMCFQSFPDLDNEQNQQQIKENESHDITQSSESRNNSSCMPDKMITITELIDIVFLLLFLFCWKRTNQDKLIDEEESEFKSFRENTFIPPNQRLSHLFYWTE